MRQPSVVHGLELVTGYPDTVKAGARTTSEIWFDSYLTAHDYVFDVEPDYGVPTHPDRLVKRDGLQAVCEVKQFDSNPLDGIPSGQGVWMDTHKPVRRAV